MLQIRGLHIDPARRLLNYNTVLTIIDKLTKCNINTLHIHLTDDQGIACESNVLNFHGGWTINEQEQIYKKCSKNHINIIPEIDIPGHSMALRSIIEHNKYTPTDKMGIISDGVIKLDYINKIIEFYEEIYQRFKPQYFHMGGDETRGITKQYFQTLVDKICEWGNKHHINIIAWEDVLNKIDPPNNLIIQRWKQRIYPQVREKLTKIGESRIIYSNNYYLDKSIDIFTAYRAKIPKQCLGCIACTWGELIDTNNIEHVVFPAMYLLGKRWFNSEIIENPITILINECDRIGWINSGQQMSWKRRQWASFVLDQNKPIPKRSCSSVTTNIKLDREPDQYPLISKLLIMFADDIYNYEINKKNPSQNKQSLYKKALLEANVNNELIDVLWKCDDVKKILRKIRHITEIEEQELYKNGIRMVIRECLRLHH